MDLYFNLFFSAQNCATCKMSVKIFPALNIH